jgi:hypothetical protein
MYSLPIQAVLWGLDDLIKDGSSFLHIFTNAIRKIPNAVFERQARRDFIRAFIPEAAIISSHPHDSRC